MDSYRTGDHKFDSDLLRLWHDKRLAQHSNESKANADTNTNTNANSADFNNLPPSTRNDCKHRSNSQDYRDCEQCKRIGG